MRYIQSAVSCAETIGYIGVSPAQGHKDPLRTQSIWYVMESQENWEYMAWNRGGSRAFYQCVKVRTEKMKSFSLHWCLVMGQCEQTEHRKFHFLCFFKLHSFKLKKVSFCVMNFQHCNSMSKKLEISSVELFKTWLDTVLDSLLCLTLPFSGVGSEDLRRSVSAS